MIPFSGEKRIKYESSEEEPNLVTELLRWILDATRAKIKELIEKFQVLVNEVLGSVGEKSMEEAGVEVEDKVTSSLLLLIVILLIVVVARAHGF